MVSRTHFLEHDLQQHTPFDEREQRALERIIAFVSANPDCFFRSNLTGHITASAFVVDPERKQALLVHHAKLDKWLQPGGHIEEPEDPSLIGEAIREVMEETGVLSLQPHSHSIFDVDVHPIPARGNEPAHDHYDIRFLLQADPDESLVVSDESHDVRWVLLDDLASYTQSPSMMRLAARVKSFR